MLVRLTSMYICPCRALADYLPSKAARYNQSVLPESPGWFPWIERELRNRNSAITSNFESSSASWRHLQKVDCRGSYRPRTPRCSVAKSISLGSCSGFTLIPLILWLTGMDGGGGCTDLAAMEAMV